MYQQQHKYNMVKGTMGIKSDNKRRIKENVEPDIKNSGYWPLQLWNSRQNISGILYKSTKYVFNICYLE